MQISRSFQFLANQFVANKFAAFSALALFLLFLVTACAPAATLPTALPVVTQAPAPTLPPVATDAPAVNDRLAEVKKRGKLMIATDANYKPQSFKNPDNSWEGFDIEVGREIAKRLGVQAEFLDISWDVITAGGWNGRWDINIGSMTVTPDRRKVILFTEPYYYTPAAFAVHKDSKAQSIDDLKNKKIGVGTATTYADYLDGTLVLENETIVIPAPGGATKAVYDTDALALADLALGDGTRLDGALTALPTIDNAIKEGQPLRILGDPVYYEQLAVALDKTSPQPSDALQTAIDLVVKQMHQDGTLTALSNKYYGVDLTSKK